MTPYFGTPLKKLNQSQIQFFFLNSPNTSTELMRNNNNSSSNNNKQTSPDDDESWEIRAFEEDTAGNLLGCTWPPRSYTCTFCRREFRSAQALGGHMNVHRRDRARLHDAPLPPPPPQPLLIQTGRELVANGFCLLYPLPNPKSILSPLPNDTTTNSVVSSVINTEPSISDDNNNDENTKVVFAVEEELDLELRLGRKPAEK